MPARVTDSASLASVSLASISLASVRLVSAILVSAGVGRGSGSGRLISVRAHVNGLG
jgi:hypothetical protein